MNKLSWLIYWADAAPQIALFVCIVSCLAFIATLILVVIGLTGFFGDEAKYNLAGTDYQKREYAYAYDLAPRFRKLWPFTLIAFLLWGASFWVPSKETFYMIAASEAGEQAIQTPEFTKVRQVLNHWLDNEIAPGTTDTKTK